MSSIYKQKYKEHKQKAAEHNKKYLHYKKLYLESKQNGGGFLDWVKNLFKDLDEKIEEFKNKTPNPSANFSSDLDVMNTRVLTFCNTLNNIYNKTVYVPENEVHMQMVENMINTNKKSFANELINYNLRVNNSNEQELLNDIRSHYIKLIYKYEFSIDAHNKVCNNIKIV